MKHTVILCADELYQQQLRNILSLGGLRVLGCKTLSECLDIHRQYDCDLTLMITDKQTTNHQILWFLEEMKVNANHGALWAITAQTSILDEHRLIRRDVVLLHPDDVTPNILAEALVVWRAQHQPLRVTLHDVMSSIEPMRLSAMIDIEVDGQNLGSLHYHDGHLVEAIAPGVRGPAALNFFGVLERADLYLREPDGRYQGRSPIQWRRMIQSSANADHRVREVVGAMLNDGVMCLGPVGQVQKWRPPRPTPPKAQPVAPVVVREYALGNELGDRSTNAIGSESTSPADTTSDVQLEEIEPPQKQPPPEPEPQEEDPYAALFREATLAYARRDYVTAMARFEECLALRPDDRRVQHNLNQIKQRITG